MTSKADPKLSLVAQFDDLIRNLKILTRGNENELKTFCESQRLVYLKLQESEENWKHLTEKQKNLESEVKRLETHSKHLKDLVERAVNNTQEVESEKNSLERQINIIKQVLLDDCMMDNQTREKLAFLRPSKANSPPRLETVEEIACSFSVSEFTRTDNSLDVSRSQIGRQSMEKRSSSEGKLVVKRVKLNSHEMDPFTDIYENSFAYRPSRRFSSVPSGNSPEKEVFHPDVTSSVSTPVKKAPHEFGRSAKLCTPVNRYSTAGKLSRSHLFVTKVAFRPEKCNVCSSSIKFMKNALKCEDCRIICHPECKDKCPLPCVPAVKTPLGYKDRIGTIADFTSSVPPMIPQLIVHCINEIESRGLKEIGLYRISGSDREIKRLKMKFWSDHSVPLLNQTDIHAVCGLLKEFLRSLTEPLITNSAKAEFISAAEMKDMDQSLSVMYDLVSKLPQPNRDTLAFLILHLQRVAESPDCKMPLSSLAKMLGPAVFGYSSPETGDILGDTKNQYKIMERLLSISSDLWNNLLNLDPELNLIGKIKTPEPIPAPKGTRLGPLKMSKTNQTIRASLISRGSKHKS